MDVAWDSKKRVLSISSVNSTDMDLTQPIPYEEITKSDISKIKVVYNWFKANYKKSGIHFKKKKDTMYVLISAGKKPTGGYTMGLYCFAI